MNSILNIPRMNIQRLLHHKAHQMAAIFHLAFKKFLQIDGTEWAGGFAYNAFFSLFPLMLLLVTIASAFFAHEQVGAQIIAYVEAYVPIEGDMQSNIFNTVEGVIEARGRAGVIAFLILVWVAHKCFTTLISATNRAWGVDAYSWWKLPLKSLVLLGLMVLAVLLSIATPMLIKMVKEFWFPSNDFQSWVYTLGGFFIPWLVVFSGLSVFYKLAPRRATRFSEVWMNAIWTTLLLFLAQSLFGIYLNNFAEFNALYGTFGGIMALLLWIYLSGCIFIFGACLCAAQAEQRKKRDHRRYQYQHQTA